MDALGILQRLGSGRLIEDLALALTEVAQLVVTTEKPGTVTLTLKVAKVESLPAVTVTEQIKQGPPVPGARGALLFAIGDGELHQQDPRQSAFEFKVVADPATGVRTLDDAAQPAKEAI